MAEKRVFTVIPTIGDPAGGATAACATDGVTTKDAPLPTALLGGGVALATFVAAAGSPVGSIGVFDADTNQTVTGAPLAAGITRIFIAVKTAETNADGTHIIRRSKVIERADITTVDNFGTDGAGQHEGCEQAKEITLDGFTADCDTEYCIKIRYESEKIKQTYGFQDLVKTYTYTTSCCGDDCACPDGDCAELAYGIAKAVNDDPDNLVTAIAEKFAGGVWGAIVEADFGTGILCTDTRVRFVGETGTFFDGCGPNPMEIDFANNDFYIGLTCGFECNGTVTDTQAIAFAEGLGEQIQNLEAYADGYSRKFGIYRIPFPRTVVTKLATAGIYYDIVTIEYYDRHDSANTATRVASPEKVIVALASTNAATLAGMF